jgi:hypothetical protein
MGTQTAPVASAGSTGSPTQAAIAVADNALSPGAGSGEASPVSSPESGNIKQLREQYETLKGQLEPYSKLGKVEDLQFHSTVAGKITQSAVELGAELGYAEEEIRASLATDPQGTIDFLRTKQAEATANGGQPDIKKLLDKELSQRLQPFEQEREQRLIEKAHTTFDSAFEAQIAELYKDEQPTSDEMDELYERTFRMLERDQEMVKQLKEGKSSGVAKLVQAAKTSFDKAYLARSARESKGIKPPAPQGNGQGSAKVSLDDMIQGNFPKDMKF